MSFMPVHIIFVTKEIGAKIFRGPCENVHLSNGSLAPKSQEHNPLYIGDLNQKGHKTDLITSYYHYSMFSADFMYHCMFIFRALFLICHILNKDDLFEFWEIEFFPKRECEAVTCRRSRKNCKKAKREETGYAELKTCNLLKPETLFFRQSKNTLFYIFDVYLV